MYVRVYVHIYVCVHLGSRSLISKWSDKGRDRERGEGLHSSIMRPWHFISVTTTTTKILLAAWEFPTSGPGDGVVLLGGDLKDRSFRSRHLHLRADGVLEASEGVCRKNSSQAQSIRCASKGGCAWDGLLALGAGEGDGIPPGSRDGVRKQDALRSKF